jgi:hypothetical protein
MEEKPKKKKGKLLLAVVIMSVLCVTSVLAYAAWTLVTTTQTVEVIEGVEMRYWDGDSWENIEMNGDDSVTLPTLTLNPGECGTTVYQIRNIADGGVLNVNYLMSQEDYMDTSVSCNTDSMDGLIFNFEEPLLPDHVDNSLDMQLSGDSTWKSFKIYQCLDGASSIDSKSIEGTLSRSNSLDRYIRGCTV